MQRENESPIDQEPDRPLECTECKKEIAIKYTEIVENLTTVTVMCSDCPALQKKLHGVSTHPHSAALSEGGTGLACGNCGTTLDAIRVGTPLGCNECYEVFGDIILDEMMASGYLPQRTNITKKARPIHIGRQPGEAQEINPSLRLLALNEALNETLAKEDYEQAAWLRDQIKELTQETEKKHGKKK